MARWHRVVIWVNMTDVAVHRHRFDAEESEMRALVREHEGLVHQVRMEHLGKQLERRGKWSVSHCDNGFSGDRMTLVLDGGWIVRLKLYCPVRTRVSALRTVAWHDHEGWVIGATSAAGDHVVLCAWSASVTMET